MSFIHLHVHSNHSHLRSTLHAAEIPILAKKHNMSAVAITDLNTIAGAIMFYKACKDLGIKPIIGAQIDDQKTKKSIILLAKNQQGYNQICKTITLRRLDTNFSLIQTIKQLSTNVIILTPYKEILTLAHSLNKHTFLEITDNNKACSPLDTHTAPQKVATNNIHLNTSQDLELYKILRAIDKNSSLSNLPTSTLEKVTKENHFKSKEEMIEKFKNNKQAIENTIKITESCNFEFETNKYHFPKFKCQSSNKKLRNLCYIGLKKRIKHITRKYLNRLHYELSMIDKLGFNDYFLVVWDIAQFAKQSKIPSIGRGSGANSLVSFCLEITHVDPIKHNLYFERFLNPARSAPPDIDLDFCWKNRTKILEYVFEKYGKNHVAMICTTVTFGLRSSFREIARIMGLEEKEISKITKKFPYFVKPGLSINELKSNFPTCKELPLENEPYQSIYLLAQRLSSFPRHLSVHPGGIIICSKEISNYTAQQKSANQIIVTQYDMYSIEHIKLIKIDLLGNRSLSVYKDCLEQITQTHLPKTNTQKLELALNDKNTQNLIKTGQTIGCFYIESPAMRSLLQKLQTTTFEALTAASSVIRPGVAESGMMDQYIKYVRNPNEAKYLHPKMKELLSDTFGVMIYQEDVLKIAHHIAGMSLSSADILRRGMSGKARSKKTIQTLFNQFSSGCSKNNIAPQTAKEIWRQIESFAGYSFCKAHSASYAQLSFKVAYLKYYYPAEFLAAVINNGGGFYSTSVYIREAQRLGLKILLPCINHSEYKYTGKTSQIRMGLSAVKSIPFKTKLKIITEKNSKKFSDLYDFIQRTKISQKNAEFLILCGACDCFQLKRPELMYLLSLIYQEAKMKKENKDQMKMNNFTKDFLSLTFIPKLNSFSNQEIANYETSLLGFLVTYHPLELLKQHYKQTTDNIIKSTDLPLHKNKQITLLGWCISAKIIRTRKTKEYMKFMSMEDLAGTYEITLFPQTYKKYAHITFSQGPYIIQGTVNSSFGQASIIANKIGLCTLKSPISKL
jgi:DNA-directed DNA polymerase III PolC